MKLRILTLGLGLALSLAMPRGADAHFKLLDPEPINQGELNGAQCGAPAGTVKTTTLTAGSQATVHWLEAQPHTGTFQLAYSTDGTTFTELNASIPHAPNPSPFVPTVYEYTITVPTTPCDHCTLRFALNEGNAINYVSCADVQVLAATIPDAGVTGEVDAGEPLAADAGTTVISADAGVTTTPAPPASTGDTTEPTGGAVATTPPAATSASSASAGSEPKTGLCLCTLADDAPAPGLVLLGLGAAALVLSRRKSLR